MSDPPQQPIPPPAERVPPRYGWLKRIALASALLLAAAAGLHLWWMHHAEQAFARALAEAQVGSDPLLEATDATPVPDAENAAELYTRAAQYVHENPAFERAARWRGSAAFAEAEQLTAIRELRSSHPVLFEWLREASRRPRVAWPGQPESGLNAARTPDMRDLRTCVRVLALHAAAAQADRTTVEWLDTIGDIYRLSDAVAAGETADAHNLAVGIAWYGAEAVEAGLPDLTLTGESRDGAGCAPALAALDRLMTLLRDETAYSRGFARVVSRERAQHAALAQRLASPPEDARETATPARHARWLHRVFYRPLFDLAAVRMLEHFNHQLAAAQAPSWPEYVTRIAQAPTVPGGVSAFDRPTAPLNTAIPLPFARLTQLHYRGLADRRLAVLALTIRSFQLDQGTLPESLAALVDTGYLPGLPDDPFAVDQPLRYRTDETETVVYSVGIDGVDDGGSYAVSPRGRVRRDEGDLVLFLDGGQPRFPLP